MAWSGESQGIPAPLPLQRKAGLYYNKNRIWKRKRVGIWELPGREEEPPCHVEKTQPGGPFWPFFWPPACISPGRSPIPTTTGLGLPVGVERLVTAGLNSRYGGTALVLAMTRSQLMKTLVMGAGMFLIPWLAARLTTEDAGERAEYGPRPGVRPCFPCPWYPGSRPLAGCPPLPTLWRVRR